MSHLGLVSPETLLKTVNLILTEMHKAKIAVVKTYSPLKSP